MVESQDIIIEPPLYFANDHIFDLKFHPTSDLLACCLITGEVKVLKYNQDDVIEILNMNYHQDSCRSCVFTPNGLLLASGSKDKSIGLIDGSSGKLLIQQEEAHSDPINIVQFLNDNILASGDDEGEIKIWDVKANKLVFDVHEQTEAISDIQISNDMTLLYAVSLDGSLASYDLRKSNNSKEKLFQITDSVDKDLLALQIVKNGRYILASSSEGVIYIYNWDELDTFTDKISGHPNSIDAMIKLDENTIFTGSEDGFLRGISIFPNKILKILGKHSEDDEHFPIQKISLSRCKNFIASSSHDSSIKFYDVSKFVSRRTNISNTQELQQEEELAIKNSEIKKQKKIQKMNQMEEEGEQIVATNGGNAGQLDQIEGDSQNLKTIKQNKEEKDSDFSDDSEDDDEMEDEDDDDEDDDDNNNDIEEEKNNKKKRKRNKVNVKQREQQIKQKQVQKFFKNL